MSLGKLRETRGNCLYWFQSAGLRECVQGVVARQREPQPNRRRPPAETVQKTAAFDRELRSSTHGPMWRFGNTPLFPSLLLTIVQNDVGFFMSFVTLAATLPGNVAGRNVREHATDPLSVLLRIPEIESLAEGVVASWHSSLASLQSRRWHRARFEKPLRVTPLDDQTELPVGTPLTVFGHDISLAGLSFIHRQPLAARKVAIAFQVDETTSESVLTILKWCRFRRDGIYQSGGQFVRALAAGAGD